MVWFRTEMNDFSEYELSDMVWQLLYRFRMQYLFHLAFHDIRKTRDGTGVVVCLVQHSVAMQGFVSFREL